MTGESQGSPEERKSLDPEEISPLSSQAIGKWSSPLATVNSAEPVLDEEIMMVSQRRFRTLRELVAMPKFLVGAVMFGIVLFMTIFAPLIAHYDPNLPNYTVLNAPPNSTHIFGTDFLGRDTWARLVWGGRISLTVGVLIVILSVAIGVPWGIISGYGGKLVDDILMRLVDVQLAFPGLVFAFAVIAILGTGFKSLVVALGLAGVPSYARVARASTLAVRELDYVQAARVLGTRHFQILRRHILPNVLDPLVIIATLNLSGAILSAAALSFLGLGTQPPDADWGTMLSNGYQYMFISYAEVLFPGLIIIFTVLSINLIGDALGEALDPRL